jgi:hypothetical protein
MKTSLFGVLVLVVALAFLLPGLGTALDDTADTVTVNETVTVDYTTNSSLSESGSYYYDNESVSVGGQPLTEGTDYEFHTETGDIQWFDTANTTSGDDANVTYHYATVDETTGLIATILQTLLFAVPLALVLGAGAVALQFSSVFSGGGI